MGADAAAGPRPGLSVVIPVVDEAARLPLRLGELAGAPGVLEVLVVDGGSTDGSAQVAARFPGVRVLAAPRGRASQLNAGAAAARGDVLLFLHADVQLPPDAAAHVARALAAPGTVAGAFKTWTVDDTGRGRLGPLLHLADLRSRYTRLPYGDQALFVRREAFVRAGGFPAQALLEDYELARRLRRLGRIARVPARVRVSGRRFLARPLYAFAVVNVLPLLYRLGVGPDWLARLYRPVR